MTATVYDQIAAFIAEMAPEKILTFKASPENQARLDHLLEKQKTVGLTEREKSEIEHFLIINRIIGLAKAQAMNALAVA